MLLYILYLSKQFLYGDSFCVEFTLEWLSLSRRNSKIMDNGFMKIE